MYLFSLVFPFFPKYIARSGIARSYGISMFSSLRNLHPVFQIRQWQATPVLLPGKSQGRRSLVGCSPWGRKESDTTERLHFHFHALEKEMATHSSVLAWRIPGMAEPGGLPSMRSHRVGHDWSDLATAAAGRLWVISKSRSVGQYCNIIKHATHIHCRKSREYQEKQRLKKKPVTPWLIRKPY